MDFPVTVRRPLRRRRELLPVEQRGEPGSHRDGERDAGRRPPDRTDGSEVDRDQRGARTVTTNQILIGVGLILVLAAASQVVANQLRVPALIILLPVGFVAGALTSDVNPQNLLGPAFQPLVSLAVAVILYDAGLSLQRRKLRGREHHVIRRLVSVQVWTAPLRPRVVIETPAGW